MYFPFFSKQCIALIISTTLLMACKDKAPAPPQAPPEVAVVTMSPTSLTVNTEFPGRLEAARTAEVRARVAGVVLKRYFTEGSLVKAGERLYQIDPALFNANIASAKAALERSEALALTASAKAARYQALIESNAVSQQEYDEAMAAKAQAHAEANISKAALAKAQLDLSYANVTAPISGRIGRALVTEGALVGQDGATPLALIQAITPMYVLFNQPASEVARMKQAIARGELKSVDQQTAVQLILDDGQIYPEKGKLLFTDITVDPSTAMVTLRAEFANPNQTLLPGAFMRIRLNQGIDEHALLVPQQAVNRSEQGTSVLVVGAGDKVEPRVIKIGAAKGDAWLVEEGLHVGDRVIVEGVQKAPPGTVVKPVPYTPQAISQNTQSPAVGVAGTSSSEK